jgi:hypothetical protein
MGYAENAGSYWRGRYKISTGRIETVRDRVTGKPLHFDTKRDAKRAADRAEAESDVQEAQSLPTTKYRMTFGQYVRS